MLVDVDGKGYYAPVKDGEAVISIPNLEPGNYTAEITYLGDDNYTTCEGDASFNVAKVNSTVSVNVENITVGDKAVINVEVPEDVCFENIEWRKYFNENKKKLLRLSKRKSEYAYIYSADSKRTVADTS